MTAPVRYPRPLRAGDLIAVVAPSSGVKPAMWERLDAALTALRDRGFRVREGETLRQQHQGASGSAEQRAAELMAALLDPEVAAVIPPWGGERAIELLGLLDFDRLRDAPPKWFSGFSDLSTLQLPLLLRAGWASVHGPNLMQLGDPALDAVSARVVEAWSCDAGTPWSQSSAPGTVARRLEGGDAALHFEGRLIGGCLDTVARLAGSPLGNVAAFRAALGTGAGVSAGTDRPIVFLENAEMKPFELARALHGLRLAGWFEGAAGVLLGRSAVVAPAGVDPATDFTERDAVRSALGGLACPVLMDLDIGHVAPQWSLVQGAAATVEWRDGRATLVQRLV